MKSVGAITRLFGSVGRAAAPAGDAVGVVDAVVKGLAVAGLVVAPGVVAVAAGSLCLIACGCAAYDRFVREPRRERSEKEAQDAVAETRDLLVRSLREGQDAAAQRAALVRVLEERAAAIGSTLAEVRRQSPDHPLAAMRDLVDCLGPDAPADAGRLGSVLASHPDVHASLAVYIEREFDGLRLLCGVTIDELSQLREESGAAVKGLREGIQGDLAAESERIIRELGVRPRLDLALGDPAHNPLYYSAQRVPFLGRQRERRNLLEFLVTDRPAGKPHRRDFWWMFQMGPGGAGKSRLAFELCLEAREMGWDAGFLRDGFDQWHRWTIRRPTLVVIDYAAERANEVAEAIGAMADRTDLGDTPVRFLLIERAKGEAWWRELWSEGQGRGGKLSASAWRDGQPIEPDGLHALSADVLHDMVEWVIADVAERVRGPGSGGATATGAVSAEEARARGRRAASLNALEGFWDDPAKRSAWRTRTRARLGAIDPQGLPLMAAVAGEAMVESGSLELASLSKRDLLDKILDREVRHWRERRVDDQHANLIALATMMGGVRIGAPAAAGSAVAALVASGVIPALEDVSRDQREHLCTLTAAGKRADVDLVPQIEPDIFGEAFVMGRLENRRELWLDEKRNDKAKNPCVSETRGLIAAAWASEPAKMREFALRAVMDFPRTACVDGLFPVPVTRETPRSAGRAASDRREPVYSWWYSQVVLEAADALCERRGWEAAGRLIDRLARAIEDGTVPSDVRDAARNDLAGAYVNRGVERANSGDAAGAIEDYGLAIEIREALRGLLEPEGQWPPAWRNDLAGAYMNRGNARANSGNAAGAIEDYDRAITLHAANRRLLERRGEWFAPMRVEFGRSHVNRGRARLRAGDRAGACADFREAAAIEGVPEWLGEAARAGVEAACGG